MKESILDVVYEIANDLYDAGVIDAMTLHEYDAVCIPINNKRNLNTIVFSILEAK